jgi:hypothetical protein
MEEFGEVSRKCSSPRLRPPELETEPTSAASLTPAPRTPRAPATPTTPDGTAPGSPGAAPPTPPASHRTQARSPPSASLPRASSPRLSSTPRSETPPASSRAHARPARPGRSLPHSRPSHSSLLPTNNRLKTLVTHPETPNRQLLRMLFLQFVHPPPLERKHNLQAPGSLHSNSTPSLSMSVSVLALHQCYASREFFWVSPALEFATREAVGHEFSVRLLSGSL